MDFRHNSIIGEISEIALLALGLIILLCQSIALATERPRTLAHTPRSGLRCMALVDPTINTDPGDSHTLLKGVQPDTAVYLQRVAPEAIAFFHSHWNTNVTTLAGTTYRHCFGDSRSNNPPGTSTIFLNGDLLHSPKLKAVAIAHELVHAEHGNPEIGEGQHTFRHLFITEEGEAHLADQVAAIRLHTKSLDSPLWALIFNIGTLPLLYAWIILTVIRVALLAGKTQKHPSAHLRDSALSRRSFRSRRSTAT